MPVRHSPYSTVSETNAQPIAPTIAADPADSERTEYPDVIGGGGAKYSARPPADEVSKPSRNTCFLPILAVDWSRHQRQGDHGALVVIPMVVNRNFTSRRRRSHSGGALGAEPIQCAHHGWRTTAAADGSWPACPGFPAALAVRSGAARPRAWATQVIQHDADDGRAQGE